MKVRNVLKLIGAGVTAGITGGYLALRMRKPKTSYADFLRVYASLSVDFVRRLENSFVETMVSDISLQDRSDLEALLDRSATFNEKMRFFQQRIPDFEELSVKALNRFYQTKGSGLGGSSLEAKVIEFSGGASCTGVPQLFVQLDEVFDQSIAVNLNEKKRLEMAAFVAENPDSNLVDRLRFYRENFSGFGSVLFDAISRFESKVYNISLP